MVITALLYVHQHIEILKVNYVLDRNEKEVAQLLDQNRALVYNIEKLEDPYLLEAKLKSNNVVLAMPAKCQIIGSGVVKKEVKVASQVEGRKSFFDFLIPKALAKEKPTRQ